MSYAFLLQTCLVLHAPLNYLGYFGGGDGNRTRVQTIFNVNVYERRLCIRFKLDYAHSQASLRRVFQLNHKFRQSLQLVKYLLAESSVNGRELT